MRIHELIFTGVGPYRQRQHVDFDQLRESGLYLINGPTGAGKSTIIDAIVFALYGRPAGDDSDEARLRSDFAAPNERTEVELVFETADGRFRVLRSPRYLRAQKRGGEALTTEAATCKLFRIHSDGHEVEVARTIASANAELQATIGLSADQFLQTVVLPQGQFATFLRAKTVDREAILQRIFGTRLYEEVAKLLKEDAKLARTDKDAASARIREALIAIDARVALGAEALQHLLEYVSNGLDTPLLAGLRDAEPALEAEAVALATAAAEAAAQAASTDALRTLASKERAARESVAMAQALLVQARSTATSAWAAVEQAHELAASLGIAIDDAVTEQAWRDRASAAATAAGALQGALEAERASVGWHERETAQQAGIQRLLAEAEQGRLRLNELPSLLEAQQHIAAARPGPDEVAALVQRQQALDADAALFTKIDSQAGQLPELTEQLRLALRQASEADSQYAEASRRFIDSLAATLALDLQEGRPCPVCGSLEHPRPASPDDTHVSREQVDALEVHARRARDEAVKAEQGLQRANADLADLERQATRSREDLQAAQAQFVRDEAALNARNVAAAQAEVALQSLRDERDYLGESIAALGTTIAVAEADLASQNSAHRANLAKAEEGRGAFPSVAARMLATEQLVQQLGALADALRDLAAVEAAEVTAGAALSAFASREGFADLEAAEAAFASANAAKSEADDVARTAARRLSDLRDGIGAVAGACEERARRIADNADLIHLADLFNPGRGADSGLHIYVLQALFANVVEAANRRFETLLSGRFRLLATRDEGGDARSVLGLGLAVQDGLTGKTRPATSLSGGETFCASLALALGLADVVRMGSGGIEIGSLFIDEGFGSLDPKPLEDVMTMLRQLGSHGRLVGLISHVPEMKTAIAEKITVIQAGEDRPTELQVSWMA